MKNILFIIFCCILIASQCSNGQSPKNKKDCLEKRVYPTEEKSRIEIGNQTEDTIKIEFGNQFVLYWDSINNIIIRDDNYYNIKKNKSDILALSKFIINEDIVCKKVWSKEGALKKGDVVFLYLILNEMISVMDCLDCQFDVWDNCFYPEGVLDSIESNRDLVYQKVQKHLKSKYNYPD